MVLARVRPKAALDPLADLAYSEIASEAERRCIAYFRERSSMILQGMRIEELFPVTGAGREDLAGTTADP